MQSFCGLRDARCGRVREVDESHELSAMGWVELDGRVIDWSVNEPR